MNFIIKMLSLFIPISSVRRKFRRYAKYLLFFKSKHYLSVLAIAKDEGENFKEWLDYHILMGVDKFYIYDNQSSDNTFDVLKPYIYKNIVEYIYWPGQQQQLLAYADWLSKHKFDTRWVAIIDLDEFILPKSENNIKKFLKKIPLEISQILIGWNNFGSSGYNKRPNGLTIRNYLWRDRGAESIAKKFNASDFGKAIIRPYFVNRLDTHIHLVQGRTVDELLINHAGDRIFSRENIVINHYNCKSRQEFLYRTVRGDVRHSDMVFDESNWTARDTNIIYDDEILKYADLLENK